MAIGLSRHMCSILSLPLLFLFIDAALAKEPQASAFEYELSMSSRPQAKTYLGIRAEEKPLQFRGASIKRVPGDSVHYSVYMMVTSTAAGIDAVASEEGGTDPMPEYPPDRPERGFHFEVNSLQLSPAGKATVRIRFKDFTDTYSLSSIKGTGLRLEPVHARFGKIAAATIPDFVNLSVAEGEFIWQCNPLTVSAMKNGKPLWSTDIFMRGQPLSVAVLEKCLFVKTSGGHSFYVMKDSGEILLYDSSLMTGTNPSDDILALWRRDLGLTFSQREKRGFFRFIKAAVLLDEKRSIPLLIECVENGFGLDEKCAAIAALEKFHGNPNLWPRSFPIPPSYFLKGVGMHRVFPAKNAKAERQKWEKIFEDQVQK